MSVLSTYLFAFLCLCNLSILPAAFKNMSTKKDQTIFLLLDVPQLPPQGIEGLHAAARCLLLFLFLLILLLLLLLLLLL
jgi:hypothetical protein